MQRSCTVLPLQCCKLGVFRFCLTSCLSTDFACSLTGTISHQLRWQEIVLPSLCISIAGATFSSTALSEVM